MSEYLRKIAAYGLILQKSADLFFYWKSCFYLVLSGQVRGNLSKFGDIWAKMVVEGL